jgi:hypothetical protein
MAIEVDFGTSTEIVEAHHRWKADAPSHSAELLAEPLRGCGPSTAPQEQRRTEKVERLGAGIAARQSVRSGDTSKLKPKVGASFPPPMKVGRDRLGSHGIDRYRPELLGHTPTPVEVSHIEQFSGSHAVRRHVSDNECGTLARAESRA